MSFPHRCYFCDAQLGHRLTVKLDADTESLVCDGCEVAFKAGREMERLLTRDALRQVLPGWSCRRCGSSITSSAGVLILHKSSEPCADCIKVMQPLIERLEER